MEMTAEHAFLPDIFFFLTFEKKQMINQDSVVMQVKVVEDEPTKDQMLHGSRYFCMRCKKCRCTCVLLTLSINFTIPISCFISQCNIWLYKIK